MDNSSSVQQLLPPQNQTSPPPPPPPPQLPQQQQPQQQEQHQKQQNQQQQSSSKNTKNLSFKEFFTTRLMRTRSFEGGPHSPKDETPNWFDEFKARMTKRSQATSSKQPAPSSNSSTVDDDIESTSDIGAKSQTKSKHHKEDHSASSSKRETCDTLHSKLINSEKDLDHESADELKPGSEYNSSAVTFDTRTTRSRRKKPQRISCIESPDFDQASIHTIFNRRDSRYKHTARPKTIELVTASICNLIKWIILHSIPFNYNLPWKLLTLINFTFVILVIGYASDVTSSVTALNFFNGFISGLVVASICLILVGLSFVMLILPESSSDPKSISSRIKSGYAQANIHGNLASPIPSCHETKGETKESSVDQPEQTGDFSAFEVLDNEDRDADNFAATRNEVILDDEDYKGWMIEFIGDYELRNRSEIKLKLIFVKIENRVLYLCKPKSSHDAESATFPVFVSQRVYDLNETKKFSANLLLPKNVRNRQKLVWSKKYPIRLEFNDPSEQQSKASDIPKLLQFTLFAKSCREKEEWFRRFKTIVEDNRLLQGNLNIKRISLQSNLSGKNDDSSSVSVRNFETRSPSLSLKRGDAQTSQSSHLVADSKRETNEEGNFLDLPTNLIRTKSCEHLKADQATSGHMTDTYEEDSTQFIADCADDSTLTRETAEMFSQTIEYSNFIESRSTLNYREYIERVIDSGQEATSTSDWFNALTGRIFFDVFSHNYWSVWFKRKIQRKLYRIRLPYFMETLTLTTIDLGTNAPQFLNVVSHSFDSFGLSIDFDMAYSGGLTMTFETKLNLLKIKSDNSIANSSNLSSTATTSGNNNTSVSGSSCLDGLSTLSSQANESSQKDSNFASETSFSSTIKSDINKSQGSSNSTKTSGESSDSDDSESDSSSDSSYNEADVDEISDWEDYGAEKTRQNIVRLVDKIASSRYFQHATENRYIKKKLQDISNCPLVLVVQILSLNGVLTLNVPPPQTDRVWYGFKPNPELTLKALPKMGDREVNLTHVTDWIERKLAEEFRKILVIPNMEDIVLPVLKSDHLSYVTTTN